MAIQSAADAGAELLLWYAARSNAANGKSHTITTSAGTRTVTQRDMTEINETIALLERRCSADTSGKHSQNFSLANFNNTLPR